MAAQLGALGQIAFVVVPAGPLAVFALWFGYTGSAGRDDYDFVPLYWLALPLLALASVAGTAYGLYRRGGVSEVRGMFLVIASLWLAGISLWNTRDLGCWLWEQRELAPRASALRASLEEGRSALGGLHVLHVKRCRQGFLLYRQTPGVIAPGFGLFVADSVSRTPEKEGTIEFDASSVPGIFDFHEY